MGGCRYLSCVCNVVLPQSLQAAGGKWSDWTVNQASADMNDVSPAVMAAGASQKQKHAPKTIEIQNSTMMGEDPAHLSDI